jgi:hypothetical protein
MISRPARSSWRARANTSNADSVPSRAILGAKFMKILLAGSEPATTDFSHRHFESYLL